jgi:uncharacterized protein YjbI with pentapeptide repeats
MKITEQTLKDKSACSDGVKAFNDMFPDGFDRSDWTQEKQIEILKSPLGRYLGWAHVKGIVPVWSMQGANLEGAYLGRANLEGARYTKYTAWPEGFNIKNSGAIFIEV